MLTRALLLGIAAIAAVGAWRLARWYWRPRLVLPEGLRLEPARGGVEVWLDVRNEGAGRSRNCRAVLVRCERREAFGWLRVETTREAEHEFSRGSHGSADPGTGGTCIPAGGSASLRLDRRLPAVSGTYRLDVAVLNGEEKRASYVVEVEAESGDDP